MGGANGCAETCETCYLELVPLLLHVARLVGRFELELGAAAVAADEVLELLELLQLEHWRIAPHAPASKRRSALRSSGSVWSYGSMLRRRGGGASVAGGAARRGRVVGAAPRRR